MDSFEQGTPYYITEPPTSGDLMKRIENSASNQLGTIQVALGQTVFNALVSRAPGHSVIDNEWVYGVQVVLLPPGNTTTPVSEPVVAPMQLHIGADEEPAYLKSVSKRSTRRHK